MTQNRIIKAYQEHKNALNEFKENFDLVEKASSLIVRSIKEGGCVYICGNGGSAADAQHIAAEFVGRFQKERKALPAIALSTDSSALTSISNDYGFDDIFRRQLEAFVKPGDIFWGLSTSGNSSNVIEAAKLAKAKDTIVLSFTGRKGSPLENLSDICINFGNYATARIQEINQLAYHIICDLVEQELCEKS